MEGLRIQSKRLSHHISARSDQCGERGVILFVGAARTHCRAHPVAGDAPLSPAQQIGQFAELIQHTSCLA